jgi:hypothetical protein
VYYKLELKYKKSSKFDEVIVQNQKKGLISFGLRSLFITFLCLCKKYKCFIINISSSPHFVFRLHSPTAGDIDLDPVEPVGEGIGLMPCVAFGVLGAFGSPPIPLELSLLFCPVDS